MLSTSGLVLGEVTMTNHRKREEYDVLLWCWARAFPPHAVDNMERVGEGRRGGGMYLGCTRVYSA